jgi:aspartate-semialdehyde dehydrogenase
VNAERKFNVAIAGATGAVGEEMRACLEQRGFPVAEMRLLASARSKGKRFVFAGEEKEVRELAHDSFEGIDIALFSAGGSISKEFGPSAAAAGAVVIDNSSAFRMDPEVPLVVPEINPEAAAVRPQRDHRQPELHHDRLVDGTGAAAQDSSGCSR